MKSWLSLIIIVLLPLSLGADSTSHVLSYRVWKQKKVDEARSLVGELKREYRKVSVPKTPDEEDEKDDLTHRLSQAQLNLGVTRDLSANDYFVLYVAPQFKGNLHALNSAAKTLAPKDMADILRAYERRLDAPSEAGDAYGAKTGVGMDPSSNL